jgi:hypothetical protein
VRLLHRVPAPAASSTGDDLCHLVCCDDDRALCGTDVTDSSWTDDDDETTCVVCHDLDGLPCRPGCPEVDH